VSTPIDYKDREPFIWKGNAFFQDEGVLKIGTDALLLSSWIPKILHSPKNILDVGTGSGVIAILMAHEFASATITGIDHEIKAVQLAQLNVGMSVYKERIRFLHSGLAEFAKSNEQRFELIVSNPPFYVNHVLPASTMMKSAKHAVDSPAIWMNVIASLLSDDGHLCLVIPSSAAFEWIREANVQKLYCSSRLEVYSKVGDAEPKRSLLCCGRSLAKPKHNAISMYEGDKELSLLYKEWLGI